MKIGIIGTGLMGRTLGVRWAGDGHDVLFGSRDVTKARDAASKAGAAARSGSTDDAAAFGDVVLYTVRGIYPSQLLHAPQALAGKVVIDCNNTDFDMERGEPLPPAVPSLAEQLARDVPAARVVQAFTTLPYVVLELSREQLAPRGISVFLCGDDAAAKQTVGRLAEQLGFVSVDSGPLRHASMIAAIADVIRYQIARGRGYFTTLSLATMEQP